MKRCDKCGAGLPDDVTLCDYCGTTLGDPFAKYRVNTNTTVNSIDSHSFDNSKHPAEFNYYDMPYETEQCDLRDIQENYLMGIISYFSLMCLITAFAGKNSRYARFHATQGFNLFVFSILINMLGIPLLSILIPLTSTGSSDTSFTLFIFFLVFLLIKALLIFLALFGIVNAFTGKTKKLPIIGRLNLLSKILK